MCVPLSIGVCARPENDTMCSNFDSFKYGALHLVTLVYAWA